MTASPAYADPCTHGDRVGGRGSFRPQLHPAKAGLRGEVATRGNGANHTVIHDVRSDERYPAQHDSWLTSLVNVCAQSFRPSDSVR